MREIRISDTTLPVRVGSLSFIACLGTILELPFERVPLGDPVRAVPRPSAG